MSDIILISDSMSELLPMPDRSPGIHVTDVLNDLCVEFGYYPQGDDDESNIERNRVAMELGCALEDAYAERLERADPGRYVRLGEIEYDGLYGTPDLYDTLDDLVLEVKLTWMSIKHAEEPNGPKYARFWDQVKAYCKMLGVKVGRLFVVHVRGDYKGRLAVPYLWEQWFGEQELWQNWDKIRRHADVMRARDEKRLLK